MNAKRKFERTNMHINKREFEEADSKVTRNILMLAALMLFVIFISRCCNESVALEARQNTCAPSRLTYNTLQYECLSSGISVRDRNSDVLWVTLRDRISGNVIIKYYNDATLEEIKTREIQAIKVEVFK